MRVRVNFTVDLDVQQFNDAMDDTSSKIDIRRQLQEDCISYLLMKYADLGVDIGLLGRNNVYDPKQRLTVAEHLVEA